MSTSEIKTELHNFIDTADERVLHMLYSILQSDIKESDYKLSKEHIKILEERLAEHEKYPTSGSSWEDVKARIQKKLWV